MALSGTVSSDKYESRYVQLTWTGTQSVADNTTTISWTLKGAGGTDTSWYKAGPFLVVIDGKEVYQSDTRIKLYNGTTIKSDSVVISHDSKGKKKVSIGIKAAIYSANYNKSGVKEFTLDTIPRKATLNTATNFNDEENPVITYDNPAGSNASELQACIAKTDGTTILVPYRNISKSGSKYTFNLTDAERKTLRQACKSDTEMSLRFYVKTVISGNTYYHYKTRTLTIINYKPTIAPTAIEQQDDNGILNSQATGSTSRWVKGYSDISYAFNPTLRKEATVKSYSVVCGTKKGSSASGTLYNIDSKNITFKLTDSRDETAEVKISGTLVNYVKPTCHIGLTASMNGETTGKITMTLKGAFFNGALKSSGTNALTLQYRYKAGSGSYTSWTSLTPTKDGNSYSITTTLSPNFNYRTTYTFQARVQDDFYKAHSQYVNATSVVFKIQPVFDWSNEDFNFNVPVKFNGDEWHDLTYESNFKNYNDTAGNQVKYKVCGNMVFVCGIFTPKADFTSTTSSIPFASGIPAAYRPHITQHTICQGSGISRWLLSVGTNGTLNIARYGSTETGGTCSAGTWLPFSFTYMI